VIIGRRVNIAPTASRRGVRDLRLGSLRLAMCPDRAADLPLRR